MAILVTLLTPLHLLAVNLASAGPLVCIWLHGRGSRGDAAAWRLGRRLAIASLASLIVGMALGSILLAMAWAARDQGYWDTVLRFPTREYVYAVSELVFSLVCLVIYIATWERWRRRPWLHGLVAVVTATNLLYHFPALMTVLGELAAQPQMVHEPIVTHSVFRTVVIRHDVLSHVVHFIAASLAVAGAALMYLAGGGDKERGRQGDGERGRQGDGEKGRQGDKETGREAGEGSERLVRGAAWIALVATVLQLPVGLWVLLDLPAAARSGLVGGDWLAGVLMLLSLVAVFGLLHALATVALGDARRAAVRRAVVLLALVVLLMTATLSRTRHLDRPDWPIGRSAADPRAAQPA